MNATSRHLLPALALAIVLAAGCAHVGIGTTSIADIKRSPAAFEGKEVVMKGTVREGFSLGSVGDKLKLPPAVSAGIVLMETSHTAK